MNDEIKVPTSVFAYEGGFYARPVYRGISLIDFERDEDLEDMIYNLLGKSYSEAGVASGRISIRVEILSVDPRPGHDVVV